MDSQDGEGGRREGGREGGEREGRREGKLKGEGRKKIEKEEAYLVIPCVFSSASM